MAGAVPPVAQGAPSSPVTQLLGQPRLAFPTCGTCIFGVSIGPEVDLQCHLNPPHVGPINVPDPRNPRVFITINVTEWPRMNRNETGCSHHKINPRMVDDREAK